MSAAAFNRPDSCGCAQQQRVDAGKIDVGERDVQRVAGTAERALGSEALIAAGELQVVDGNGVAAVADSRLGIGRELPLLAARVEAQPLQMDFLVFGMRSPARRQRSTSARAARATASNSTLRSA